MAKHLPLFESSTKILPINVNAELIDLHMIVPPVVVSTSLRPGLPQPRFGHTVYAF